MITPEILSDIWDCAAQAHGEALNNLDRYKGIRAYEKRYQGEADTAQRVLQWCKDNDTTGQLDWWPRKES